MKKNVAPKSIWRNPIQFIAFGFGSGASPWAPGTCGTIVAIPIYLLMQPLSILAYCMITLVLTIAGIWICDITEKAIRVHDHSGIVFDEIVGYLITMIAAPRGWIWIVLGFALFRLFDIWKPWPIKPIDKKLAGGLGTMLDDVVAAIFALIVLQLIAALVR